MIEAGALVVAIFATGLLVFGTVRLTQKLTYRFYFSTIDLLRQHDLPPWGLLIRGIIPLGVGAIWGILWSDYAILVAAAGSVLGSLLTVWAAIAHPYLLPDDMAKRRLETMVVFSFYVMSYGTLGAVGVFVSFLLTRVLPKTWLGQNLVAGLITAALLGVASYLFGFWRLRAELDAAWEETRRRQEKRVSSGK